MFWVATTPTPPLGPRALQVRCNPAEALPVGSKVPASPRAGQTRACRPTGPGYLPDLTAASRPALLRRFPGPAEVASERHRDELAPLLETALPKAVVRGADPGRTGAVGFGRCAFTPTSWSSGGSRTDPKHSSASYWRPRCLEISRRRSAVMGQPHLLSMASPPSTCNDPSSPLSGRYRPPLGSAARY